MANTTNHSSQTMLRQALHGMEKKNKTSQHPSPRTSSPSSAALSHANLMKKRDQAAREFKQLQANMQQQQQQQGNLSPHGQQGNHRPSMATNGIYGFQEDLSNCSSRSNLSSGSSDSQQQYTVMTYPHANSVGNNQNHQHQRAKQLCEYIQTFCPPQDGRYMIMKVERLMLEPQFVQDDESTQHILQLLDKFEKLLQTAGIDHYEWVEFTASRNTNTMEFNYDGEGNVIPSSNHAHASTLMKLNFSQFVLELDRLCSDLQFEKFSEEEKQLLFHTIAKGNLATYLLAAGNNGSNKMNVDTTIHGNRAFSGSHDSVDTIRPSIEPSTGSSHITTQSRRRPSKLSRSILSQVYVDYCNLDVTFKKYHTHIMRMKTFHAVYHQLIDISNFMRKMKIRLCPSHPVLPATITKSNGKSFQDLKGCRISMKLPEIEKLVYKVLVQYDSHVQEFGPLDEVNLLSIQEIVNAGCYDETTEDPNDIFFQDNPIPEPAPAPASAPFFSFGNKSSSMPKHRNTSFSASLMSAVNALGALVPAMTMGQSFRQIYPTTVKEEDETLTSGSTFQRTEKEKELQQLRQQQQLPRLLSEGTMDQKFDDHAVQAFKDDDHVNPSRDTEKMEVEEIDEAVIEADSNKSFGINNEFVEKMNPEERKHFDQFLRGILEGEDHHHHHHHHHAPQAANHATNKSFKRKADETIHFSSSSNDNVQDEKTLDEKSKWNDIRKRYRVLKVPNGENGNETTKHISDVVPFNDQSRDNSCSNNESSSQLSRENTGWVYLSGNLNTGYSDRYLNTSNDSINTAAIPMQPVQESISIQEDAKEKEQKVSQKNNKESSSMFQSLNMHVSRARMALFNSKK